MTTQSIDMNAPPIRVGIVGGTGYTGAELLRILARHPRATLSVITSRTEAGLPVAKLFPHLRGQVDLAFTAPDEDALAACDVVFFATPNGTAMKAAPQLLAAGVRVIDLAADFRLKDAAIWEQWYGMPHHCPELLAEAVYGLPEINRAAIQQARLIANPGCYPTAVTLGFLPLLDAQVIDPTWLIADAKSGASGAGRKAETGLLLAEIGESFKAYAVTGHRHAPEIAQTLSQRASGAVHLTFVPHLLPMIRGIEATLYARLTQVDCDVNRLFTEYYANEYFVDVLTDDNPDTRSVRGSNWCRLAAVRQGNDHIVIVQAVIDNLVKGAAGQAIQNMNLMFGFNEALGLETLALLP